jgi:ADP-ribosylation factor-like protein 3
LIEEKLLDQVPILVFANKQDLMGLEVDEIIKELELNNINDRKWSIFACSAIKNEGISEGMKWLISNLK